MASTTQDLAFDELGAAGYTGDLTERLMNWRAAEGLESWTDYQDHIITEGAVGSNFMDAQYAFWLAGLTPPFSPLSLSPALWVDPSDASSVTISGSSGAYIGPNGLVIPASGANHAITPDAAAWDITGDIELIAKVTVADWTPSFTIYDCDLVGRTGGTPYIFQLASASGVGTGKLRFAWYQSTVSKTALSTVGVPFADGDTGWVKVTLDVDNGASGYDAKFWTSTDGSSWTQLGTTITVGSVTSIDAGATDMLIGRITAGGLGNFRGTIHRAIVKNGIAGTTVFDADFEAATPYVSAFTESALGAPVYVVSSTATSATASYAYVGPTGLVCPGSGANYASRVDAAVLTPATTLEILTRATAPDYTPTVSSSFCSKRADAVSNFGYHFKIQTAGTLSLIWGTSSTTISTDTSTVASGRVDGTPYWFRVLKDFSTGTADFYYAADSSSVPSSWTAIGTQVAGSTGTLYNDTNVLAIGIGATSPTPAEHWAGTIARTIVKCDGTTVFDADFTTAADYAATFTESSTNAATVTITATNTPANAAGALVSQINDLSGNARHLTQATAANMPRYWNGRNGYNCLVFDGASDRMKTASAIANAAPFAALAVVELGASPGANIYVFDSHTTSADVVMSTLTTTSVRIFAGTNLSAVQAVVGRRDIWAAKYDGASSTLRVNGAQVAAGNAGTSVHELVTLGSMADGTANWWKGTIGEVIFWPSPSSFTDVDSYASTKWGTP